jgi:hypothetical protein
MTDLKGQCLCGAVTYTIPDELLYAGYCHCSECRKFSGSAFSTFGGIEKSKFKFESGESKVSYYKKSEASNMASCSICGSSLFADKPQKGLVHIRLGTLVDEPSLKPQAHVFVGSKAPWYEITDTLPQFDGIPPSPSN